MKRPPAHDARRTVEFLDGARGWQPTNLGAFDPGENVEEAARNWREGFARVHGGYAPPTRIRSAGLDPHGNP